MVIRYLCLWSESVADRLSGVEPGMQHERYNCLIKILSQLLKAVHVNSFNVRCTLVLAVIQIDWMIQSLLLADRDWIVLPRLSIDRSQFGCAEITVDFMNFFAIFQLKKTLFQTYFLTSSQINSKMIIISSYMPYFSGAILGLSGIFSGTNDIFLGQILQNSGTFSSAKSVNK